MLIWKKPSRPTITPLLPPASNLLVPLHLKREAVRLPFLFHLIVGATLVVALRFMRNSVSFNDP